jgi:hypothetical protein
VGVHGGVGRGGKVAGGVSNWLGGVGWLSVSGNRCLAGMVGEGRCDLRKVTRWTWVGLPPAVASCTYSASSRDSPPVRLSAACTGGVLVLPEAGCCLGSVRMMQCIVIQLTLSLPHFAGF